MDGVLSRWRRWLVGGGAVALLGLLAALLMLPRTPSSPASPPMPAPAGTRLEATVAAATSTPAATATAVVARPRRVADHAFGRPPLLALPGEGGFGPRYALTYERTADLGTLPASADVYRLTWPVFTATGVRALGARLGLEGAVESLGPGAFQVQDSSRGRLFVAHGRILYSRAGGRATAIAIDPAGAAEHTRRWLAERRLLPAEAGPPRTRVLDEAGLIQVTFLPATPQPLVTPEPSIVVTLDGAGGVHDLDMLWPAEQELSLYPLTGLPAAWEAIKRGEAFVEIDVAPGSDPGRRVEGQARLTRATLGWALAAGTDADEAAFLEPVYIFAGTVQLAGQPGTAACHVYVPALRDYPWPRG